MSDGPDRMRTGLEGLVRPGRRGQTTASAGVLLSVRPTCALATVIARRGAMQDLAKRVRTVFGLELPRRPVISSSDAMAFVWSGANQWLAQSSEWDSVDFETKLATALDGLASVTDQSDGRIVLKISGGSTRHLLAKGMPIDLHPRSFSAGDTALTLFGHIGVHIWQMDDTPSYELCVTRSLAADLWHMIELAGAEYGIDVVAPS